MLIVSIGLKAHTMMTGMMLVESTSMLQLEGMLQP